MAVVVKRTPPVSPAAQPRHRKDAVAAADVASPQRPRPKPSPPPVVLPTPPTDSEKYAYIKRRSWILTACSLLAFPPLVIYQILLLRNEHWFLFFIPFVACVILMFAVPLLTDGLSRSFDLEEHRRLTAAWQPRRYPSVDVFLPVCGEPVEVLRNTWKHVAAMVRRYQGPITVWVLDDSASPALKSMARKFSFAYATRPNRGWYKKSGNLLYGYLISESEFILLLDADFAPRPDLLAETLPYMDANPRAGIVQSPQFFRVLDDQSWVERGAGAVQEVFYRSIQTSRNRKQGAICVGSCALYRRKALDQNKGMSLSDHSEDVRTGFDLQILGWQLLYIPIALSTGTCPDNVYAFMNQQYRWCCGTLSLIGRKSFWRSKVPLYARLCYLSGFVYYVYTAIINFAVPALSICILIFIPNRLEIRNMWFFLPVLIYSGFVYPMWHRSPFRLEAYSVRVVSGWAHAFAYWDLLIGNRRVWEPSGSSSAKQSGKRRLWIGLLGWSALTAIVWVGLAFWRLLTMDPANMLMIFALGLFELCVIARILIHPRAAGPTGSRA
jgi:cellulose synthase (UDP-forming)